MTNIFIKSWRIKIPTQLFFENIMRQCSIDSSLYGFFITWNFTVCEMEVPAYIQFGHNYNVHDDKGRREKTDKIQ